MAGAFQTSRDIFNHPIWQDVMKFRIFFYIYGNAVFAEEGIKVGNVHVKRGQFLKSYRNLIDELAYTENRKIKKYPLSSVQRKINQLVEENRLKIEETEHGTLFTVVNYELYQGLDNYKTTTWNSVGTALEQRWNNNKKEKKDKKDNVVVEESEEKKSARLIEQKFLERKGSGFFISPKEFEQIQNIITANIDLDDVLRWIDEAFDTYKPKFQGDTINSFGYCYKQIMQKHYNKTERRKPNAKTGSDRTTDTSGRIEESYYDQFPGLVKTVRNNV